MIKRLKGYVINQNGNFGTWAYSGTAIFYIAKEYIKFDDFDNEIGYSYEELENSKGYLTWEQAKNIYKNNCKFRGKSVNFLCGSPNDIFKND